MADLLEDLKNRLAKLESKELVPVSLRLIGPEYPWQFKSQQKLAEAIGIAASDYSGIKTGGRNMSMNLELQLRRGLTECVDKLVKTHGPDVLPQMVEVLFPPENGFVADAGVSEAAIFVRLFNMVDSRKSGKGSTAVPNSDQYVLADVTRVMIAGKHCSLDWQFADQADLTEVAKLDSDEALMLQNLLHSGVVPYITGRFVAKLCTAIAVRLHDNITVISPRHFEGPNPLRDENGNKAEEEDNLVKFMRLFRLLEVLGGKIGIKVSFASK